MAFPDPSVGRGVLRTGGGFTTEPLAEGLFSAAEWRAQEFRRQDGGMFNAALANHVESKTRLEQEAHAFLIERQHVDRMVGPQYYENTVPARPHVVWPQLHSEVTAVSRDMRWSGGPLPRPDESTIVSSPPHGANASFSIPQQQQAFVANDSVISLDRPTYASMNKTKISKDRTNYSAAAVSGAHYSGNTSSSPLRGGSANKSRLNVSTVSAAAKRLERTSKVPGFDRTLHSVDGSCCNYNHPVQHAKVEGLFVTFCENNVETKLFNAIRDLEIERGGREMDEKMHRQQLAAYLRQVEDLTAENKALKDSIQNATKSHSTEATDLRILKEEYERKFREQRAEWETLKKDHEMLTSQFLDLKVAAGAKQNKVDELETENRGLKVTQQQNDKLLREMQERMVAAIAQAAVASDAKAKSDTELSELKLLMAAKEQVMDGLTRELRDAEDKISGIAILRDHVRNANRRR